MTQDNAAASIVLDHIDAAQRDFILRMKPHRNDQHLSKADWENIDPCVDMGGDDWPDVYWFGGMLSESGAGRKRVRRTFRFNDVGLEVRAALADAQPSEPQS